MIPNQHEPTIQTILKAVEEVTGVNEALIISPLRKRPIVEARHITIVLTRKYCRGFSIEQVGERFSRDHASVIHASRNIKAICETDKAFRQKFDTIEGLFLLRREVEDAPDELVNMRCHILALIAEYKRLKKSKLALQTTEESVS